jgi:hypothetical protein
VRAIIRQFGLLDAVEIAALARVPIESACLILARAVSDFETLACVKFFDRLREELRIPDRYAGADRQFLATFFVYGTARQSHSLAIASLH